MSTLSDLLNRNAMMQGGGSIKPLPGPGWRPGQPPRNPGKGIPIPSPIDPGKPYQPPGIPVPPPMPPVMGSVPPLPGPEPGNPLWSNNFAPPKDWVTDPNRHGGLRPWDPQGFDPTHGGQFYMPPDAYGKPAASQAPEQGYTAPGSGYAQNTLLPGSVPPLPGPGWQPGGAPQSSFGNKGYQVPTPWEKGPPFGGGPQPIPGPTNPVPSYARGTSYVPEDQLAQLHRGEAVIPAAQNQRYAGGSPTFNEIMGMAPAPNGNEMVSNGVWNVPTNNSVGATGQINPNYVAPAGSTLNSGTGLTPGNPGQTAESPPTGGAAMPAMNPGSMQAVLQALQGAAPTPTGSGLGSNSAVSNGVWNVPAATAPAPGQWQPDTTPANSSIDLSQLAPGMNEEQMFALAGRMGNYSPLTQALQQKYGKQDYNTKVNYWGEGGGQNIGLANSASTLSALLDPKKASMLQPQQKQAMIDSLKGSAYGSLPQYQALLNGGAVPGAAAPGATGTGTTPASDLGDMSNFQSMTEAPGNYTGGQEMAQYLNPMAGWAQDQGLKGLQSTYAGSGSLNSGTAMKGISDYLTKSSINDAWQPAFSNYMTDKGFNYGVDSADRNFGYQAATGDRNYNLQQLLAQGQLGLQGTQGGANVNNVLATLLSGNLGSLGQIQGTGTMGQNNATTASIQSMINMLLGQGAVNAATPR